MKPTPSTKQRSGKGLRNHYRFRLFVVGNGPNSTQALANLQNLCREHLEGRHTIETIDVTTNFKAAIKDNILITPALVLVTPLPRAVVLGNLNDRQKVMQALRMPQGDS